MKETCAHILTPRERSFILVLWGRPLLSGIVDQTEPVGAKTPIFNLFSIVVPQP